MKVTIFSSLKTTTKIPKSPYGNNTFAFESIHVNEISEVFDKLSSNFTLNIPLIKSITTHRNKASLLSQFISKINYIILDIDSLNSSSDREITLKWFRDSKYEVILGESRSPFNLKGVLKVDPITPQEGKEILRQISEKIPGNMDKSSLNYASFQAPIMKHKVLLNQKGISYPKPLVTPVTVTSVTVPNEIEQLCINAFNKQGFSFNTITQEGYQCSHPTEHKTPGGFTWRRSRPFDITHWNQDRNVSVWKEIIQTSQYKSYQKEISQLAVKELIPEIHSKVNERYLSNYPDIVSEFLDSKQLLKIQSPMGTAKSTVIEEVIHQSRKKSLKLLFLTNRISLADDIYNKYDGLKHYLGTELEENQYKIGDDLVCQLDSLHKFSTKYFDIVIIDEAATTLMHLLTLEFHKKAICTKVFSLKKKKVVLADAFLFNEMTDIFTHQKSKIISINNSYKDNVKLEFFSQRDNFVWEMIKESKNKPVTFSSGSMQVLKIVKLIADQQNLKTYTISSETPQNERKLIFKKMEKTKPDYDILMYSPTLTVGVSNINAIGTHYHLDSGLSMNVLSSIQMTKRTREAKTIKFFLKERIKYQPTDLLRIQNELTDFNEQDEDGDSTGISKAGVDFSKLIKLNNTLENRHKVAFLELMKLQFNMSMNNIVKNDSRVKPFLSKLAKVVKENEKQDKLSVFETYKMMTPEQLQDIEYKIFNTTKDEEAIKMFQIQKQDETLKLNDSQLNLLIKGEIESPGLIHKYKCNLINKLNKLVLNENEQALYQRKNIDIIECGYIKMKNVYHLNPIILKLKGI